MINYSPILNQALGMAQMLSFAGGPLVTAGVVVASTLVELLNDAFGPGGDDALSSALQDLGTSIDAHMDEMFNALTLDLQNLKTDDADDVVSGLSNELGRDKDNIQVATGPGSTVSDLATAVTNMLGNVNLALGGDSPINQVIEFAKDNGTAAHGYATLPLLQAAAIGLSNYCKYAATVQLMLDAKSYLAYQAALKQLQPNQTPPPVVAPPSEQHGEVLNLNSSIFGILQQVIAFAQPLVQALNTAVTQRQQAADAAAGTVGVIAENGNFTLNPSVAPWDDNDMGFKNSGYGIVSQNNANILAMLVNAQHRRTAWVNATASSGLYLLGTADILGLNYSLSTMNDAANAYYAKLLPGSGLAPPAALLGGIYPAPKPYVIQPGDGLSALATKYQVSVATIMQLNNLTNPNLIIAGQTLTIPGER